MRIFETEYPQMKYLTNLLSISMQNILFWVIIVNLIVMSHKKVLVFYESKSLHSSNMRI